MREHSRWGVVCTAGVLLVLGVGCASSQGVAMLSQSLAPPSAPYRIEFAPMDAPDVPRLQKAVDAALPRLARWGALREPLTVRVEPTHAALEAAAHQKGFEWLRAWGRYDEVFVQAPSTWGLAGASQPQLDELVLHELTHCLMYQLAADRLGWTRKQIPLWFREGMASYTAQQAYRWVTLEELARYLDSHPQADPVTHPEPLYREDSNLIYGVAHHAFSFLLKRYGPEAVRGLLGEMKGGKDFPEAFGAAIGLPVEAFTRDFTHYVRWRGFRGGRPPPPSAPPLD